MFKTYNEFIKSITIEVAIKMLKDKHSIDEFAIKHYTLNDLLEQKISQILLDFKS